MNNETRHELRMTDGVFGSIMAGALFGQMRVVAGPRRHDERQRSDRIVRANAASRALNVAAALAAARTLLEDLADRWAALPVDGELEVAWHRARVS